jgi:hypothetical protein
MMYADDMLINSHSHPPESLTRFRYLMRDFSAPFFEDGIAPGCVPKYWTLSGSVRGWCGTPSDVIPGMPLVSSTNCT